MRRITERLARAAQRDPNKIALRYVDPVAHTVEECTYQALFCRVQDLARCLVQHGKKKQTAERCVAVLCYPSGVDFVVAFYACLLADQIAVPVKLPKHAQNNAHLREILAHAGADLLLTNTFSEAKLCASHRDSSSFDLLVTDSRSVVSHPESFSPVLSGDDNAIAYLQYTSGTTGKPKAVMVSHGNIMENLSMLASSLAANAQDSIVSWLPFYHDMGLMNMVLMPIYLGMTVTFCAPNHFVQCPSSWLDMVSTYRATITGGPNFALDYCVERIRDEVMDTLDLRALRILFNGSEPIRRSSIRAFVQRFSRCGLSPSALFPCYGLAEATVFVSGLHYPVSRVSDGECAEAPVAVGQIDQSGRVQIVDQKGLPCATGVEGEVWVSGAHVSQGYWLDATETSTVFGRTVPGLPYSFLATGDLGYVDSSGRLYITGRIKDVLIIRGRNIHPQSVERCLSDVHVAIEQNGVAVFECPQQDGETQLAAHIEIKRRWIKKLDYVELIKQLNKRVSDQFGVRFNQMVFVKPFSIPRSSSGKIQRSQCRALYLQQTLPCLSASSLRLTSSTVPHCAPVHDMVKMVATVLNCDVATVRLQDTLSELGVDSVRRAVLHHQCEEHFKTAIPIERFFDDLCLADIVPAAPSTVGQDAE